MTWLNLFGGPGGFCLGARECGGDPLGIEIDADVCATRRAAGLPTLERDVASLDPAGFLECEVMLASAPCPSFSQANDDRPTEDLATVLQAADLVAQTGEAIDPDAFSDRRSALTLEPLRWALKLRPRVLVCEQVPPVLQVWDRFARILALAGYSTWAGILEAERYGVPQTRERAFLLASLDVDVHPPPPTNQRYVPGHAPQHEHTLFGDELKPWVSMAEALGWDPADRVGFPRRADELAATDDGYCDRDLRSADAPAFTLTEKARSWQRWLVNGNQDKATVRHASEPASTIAFGHNSARVQWTFDRPATTVQGDSRIWPPGHKRNAEDESAGRTHYNGRDGAEAIRVTIDEAAVLQGFPRGYPWHGNMTKRFGQVGDAVPPALAAAAIRAAIGDRHGELQRQTREILEHERQRAAA